MAPSPRFRRVAALQRRFVDREPVLASFAVELAAAGAGPRVLNVTGVGGIGKSRLLHELRSRASSGNRTGNLDLQIPALRRQEDALAVLRGQLGAQGAHFDRFDLAYAVLWQRLHPHLRLSRSELSFVSDSSVLTDIVDTVAGLPVFGTAQGLLKLLDRGRSDVRRRLRIRRDPTLQTLDELPNGDLTDAVTYLFAEDLRACSDATPFVIFVDSYESLVPAPLRVGRAHLADIWLRDLVGQLDRGLVVVASREPLRWELHDAEWSGVIRTHDIGGLPMPARLELLDSGGITDPEHQRAIADASAGLPFYLNLAVDTWQRTGSGTGGSLVSREEILGRFLEHVAAEEIRSLEVLSPARIFDQDVFQTLTRAFDLPGNRIAWESLTAYSFVYPADTALRFHQLMGAALQARLSVETTSEVHVILRRLWEDRATAAAGRDGGVAGARALREAAYHALRAGRISGADVLEYADRAVRCGGHGAAGAIADDLAAYLTAAGPAAAPGRADISLALRCLRAEAAVRLGDSATAAALADPVPPVDAVVGARLAVAAAHARRIAGDTAAALGLYSRVWDRATGTARLQAGLWAADLHMAQGRFRDCAALAAELDVLIPDEEIELRGDVARLRHLAYRFALDLGAADRYLEEAAAHYTRADSVLALANIRTNRAELLALSQPTEASAAASQAIEIQRETGAHHELGKAYSALALGELRLGRLDAAEAALQSACAALDRAGYRSGRARAEYYRGVLDARLGRLDEALAAIRLAVTELEAAEVYPTVVLCAARTLEQLEIADDEVTAAARRARSRYTKLITGGSLSPADSTDLVHKLVGKLAAAYTALPAQRGPGTGAGRFGRSARNEPPDAATVADLVQRWAASTH